MILHTVNKSPQSHRALASCLQFLNAGEAIVLLEDGVYAGMSGVDHGLGKLDGNVYALTADVEARGLSTRMSRLGQAHHIQPVCRPLHRVRCREELVMSVSVAVDKEGFLVSLEDWSRDVALEIAEADAIELTDEHWRIIDIVRRYYDEFHISPPARVIVKLLERELGPDQGKSIYLMKLFTGRPARMVTKIAGLPKPTNCD